MNTYGQATGPAGSPLTRDMLGGGEEQTFRQEEPLVPVREEPEPVQPTTPTYFTPDEARSRYAQFLPIEATPNDTLLTSDDPRVYTYQTTNGNTYYLPAFEEQLQERRSVGEAVTNFVDNLPSRTEVEEALLSTPRALYDSVSRQISGEGSYGDMLNTATGLAGVNLPRTIPDNSLGMFTGNRGKYPPQVNRDRDLATLSADDPQSVWENYGWDFTNRTAAFTEISDAGSDLNHPVFNRVVNQFRDPSVGEMRLRLGDVFQSGYDSSKGTDLFSVYPELQDVRVIFNRRGNDGVNGSFDPVSGNISIAIDPRDRFRLSDNVRSTMLHEIQHWVQREEGWAATGMNTSWLEPRSDTGFWKDIYPSRDSDGGFRNDFDANLHDIVMTSRDYGDLFWQKALMEEYTMEPDRVYRSIVNNVPENSMNPTETLIVQDYEYSQNPPNTTPNPSATGWEIAETSTYNPGDLEQRLGAVQGLLEDVIGSLNWSASNIGMDSEDITDFLELGLISSSNDWNSYMSEAGEIQARNTETRKGLSGAQRYDQHPSTTEYSRQGPWVQPEAHAPRERAIQTIIRLSQGTPQ